MIDAWFRFYPHQASERGYTRYDTRTPSFTLEEVGAFRAALDQAPQDELVRSLKAAALFPLDHLKALSRDPLFYVKAALDSVESLELRGPLWNEISRRLQGFEELLGQAERQVREPIAPFKETALEMLEGAVDHFGEAFNETPAREASDRARRAIDRYHGRLSKTDAAPFEPMGPELFGKLLAEEHCLDPDPAPWVARAEEVVEQVEAELDEAPDDPEVPDPPSDFGAEEVLRYYHDEVDFMRRFVEEHQVVTIPEGELRLKETPDYMLPLIPGSFYLPPPVFSGSRRGYFFLRPIPREMDDDDRRYYWGRVHGRRSRNLIAHEIWPGHHLQFLHAAANKDPVRHLRDNDILVEGWALYCESLVAELGLWDGRPSLRQLQALRFRALRVIVDVGLHTGALTPEQAADRVCAHLGRGARPWIETEIRRYLHEPGQALSYLVGSLLIKDLREELALPLREFHDRLLAEGSIPLPLIRRTLLRQRVSG